MKKNKITIELEIPKHSESSKLISYPARFLKPYKCKK